MQASGSLVDVSAHDVELVIQDLQLMSGVDGKGKAQQRPVVLHYCVDAKEIIDFCFPLNAYDLNDVEIGGIAADQAALYELFHSRGSVPMLIPQYLTELYKFYSFARSTVEASIEEADMVQRLIAAAPEDDFPAADEEISSLLQKVERGFQMKLAVWMGIYSIGLRRLDAVLRTRLQKPTDLGLPFVESFMQRYQPSLVDEVYEDQARTIQEREKDPRVLRSRLNAAKVDASAIDWLLALNHASASAVTKGKEQHVFLYVSSAPKSRRIFESDALRKALPVIHNKPYAIWRNRTHFHLLAMAFRNAEPDDFPLVIEHLREIQRVVSDSRRIQTGGADPLSSLVSELQKSIVEKTGSISDLSFMARLTAYENLKNAKPSGKEQQHYIRYLRDIFERRDIPAAAMQRITFLQDSARTQTAIASEGLGNAPTDDTRTSADLYTHLPASRPFLADEFTHFEGRYLQLANEIFAYHTLANKRVEERVSLLEQITTSFQALDGQALESTLSGQRSTELELIRCLIYISFGGEIGERDALSRAAEMRSLNTGREREFLQIICLANLGLQRYWDSYESASRGIAEYSREWFFYQARALTTYSAHHEGGSSFAQGSIQEAVDDLKSAFDLALRVGPRPTALIANNLAYFLSADPMSPVYDLDKAQEYLGVLEFQLPPSKWEDLASFFHTKAHVLYNLYVRDGGPPERIGAAAEALDRALDINARCELYIELKQQVDVASKKAHRATRARGPSSREV